MSAPLERDGWNVVLDAPTDGRPIYVLQPITMRWAPYSPKSEQYRRGLKGRWQQANEHGGWENCAPPNGAWRYADEKDDAQ